MGQRGPRPMPTNVRWLTGNAGHRKLNRNEPKPPEVRADTTAHEPPPELSERARLYWPEYVARLAEMRVLTRADLTAVALLCESTATFWECIQKVRETGILVKVGDQGYTQRNPYLTEANAAQAQMSKLLAEFGMTPSARSRVEQR